MAEGGKNPVETFRTKLDQADSTKDQKFEGLDLEKDNANLIRQLERFLRRPEKVKAVFEAIESTAKQLGIKKMEVCRALELPPVEHVAYPYDLDKIYRVQYSVGGETRGSIPRYFETEASGSFIILDKIHSALEIDYAAQLTNDFPEEAIESWKAMRHPKSGKKLDDNDQFTILRDYFCNKIVYSIGGEVTEPVPVSQAVPDPGSRNRTLNPWAAEKAAREANERTRLREEERNLREEAERKRKKEEEDKQRGAGGRRRRRYVVPRPEEF